MTHKYAAGSRLFASYGGYDYNQFQRQFDQHQLPSCFGPLETHHMNVKKEFARLMGLKHPVGMDGALQLLNIPLEGTHHRGADDSRNIAKILVYMLQHGVGATGGSHGKKGGHSRR